mgnify:CR=1 FL=1
MGIGGISIWQILKAIKDEDTESKPESDSEEK